MSAVVPFSHGVNFTKWFEFRSVKDIQIERFTEQDFINVKSMGADVIRLPCAMHNFIRGESELDPVFIEYLDTAVNWAEKHNLYIIIDNHSFHPVNPTDENIDRILIPVWQQFARHYRDRSSYVIYEVLNEPHHIPDKRWGEIQGNAIEAIRSIDGKRMIIVGGTEYNSIKKLRTIPAYKDENLIYTFHFYDPHLFTHQGTGWGSPSLAPLSGLPFPAEKSYVRQTPEALKGTWVETALENYAKDANIDTLCATLDEATAFAKERDVPVFCGEFGVYMIQSPPEDRVKWYRVVCEALNERGISWTSWDYFGEFGIFKTDKKGDFKNDVNNNIIRAMGFTPAS